MLRPIATIQDIPAKEIINSPGDFIDGLYYIYSGRTKNYIMNADGIEKVLYTLSEGWLRIRRFGGCLISRTSSFCVNSRNTRSCFCAA